MRNAFGTARRDLLEAGLRDAVPELAGLFEQLLARETQALWTDAAGVTQLLRVGTGVPQGCPLSPAAFAVLMECQVLGPCAANSTAC